MNRLFIASHIDARTAARLGSSECLSVCPAAMIERLSGAQAGWYAQMYQLAFDTAQKQVARQNRLMSIETSLN